ncbi:MAG: LCP family protein [Faecousia sp.]
MSGRYEKKRKKRGWKKPVLIALAGVLVLLAALVIAGVVYYNAMLNKINRVTVSKINYTEATAEAVGTESLREETTEETTAAATEPHVPSSADYLNILVVGQAARDGEEERFADTALLFTINTYTKTLTLTSLLRDSFVKPPEYNGHPFGRIKLTVVYHMGSYYGDGIAGSMELMNMTLYSNFGIEVDHNFEIDFEAFVKVINMLEGVDIELTEAEADYLNNDGKVWQTVQPGMNWLDGDTALAYARMRKAEGDGESDIVRTARQRKFVEALATKLKTMNLSDLQSIANEVLPMITTSMTNAEITQTLLTLLPMLPDLTIETGGTCPANYHGDLVEIYHDGVYHSVLWFDEAETKKTMRAITEGE